MLIVTDNALIQRQVIRADGYRSALLGNPQRAKVVATPAGFPGEGENAGVLAGGGILVQIGRDIHHGGEAFELFEHLRGQGHGRIAGQVRIKEELRKIDTQLFQLELVDTGTGCDYLIRELPSGIVGLLLTVHPYQTVLDHQRVAGNGYATLDIVVFLVCGPDNDGTELGDGLLPSVGAYPGVVVVCGTPGKDRISVGKAEHHDVSPSDLTETLQAAVFVLDERGIALAAEYPVVRKGNGEGRLGDAGPVSELGDEEMVSGVQAAFHGRGRNLESLEEENIDEGYHNHGEDDGIQPVQPKVVLLSGSILFFPKEPLHLLGDKEVKNDAQAQEPPIIPQPDNPKHIQDRPETQFDPFVLDDVLPAAHGKAKTTCSQI